MTPSRRKTRITPIHPPKPRPVHPFDQTYATDTGGLISGPELRTGHPSDAHATAYYAIAPSILDALVDLWLQSRPVYDIDRYTFLDIGAGKGRALMCASLHPFLEVVGIELNPVLAGIARNNLDVFSKIATVLAPARVITGDVLDAPLPDGPTLAFMFHPFESPLMRTMVDRIEMHYADLPNRGGWCFDLLYVNAEHKSVLDARSAFSQRFCGKVPMSADDHRADMAEIAEQDEYGSTGDEICAIYRLR